MALQSQNDLKLAKKRLLFSGRFKTNPKQHSRGINYRFLALFLPKIVAYDLFGKTYHLTWRFPPGNSFFCLEKAIFEPAGQSKMVL